MGFVAAASAVAGTAMSAGSQLMSASGTAAADEYQAARAERAAEYGKTAALQTSAQGLDKLNVTLGNIEAVRAAARTDPSSPTGLALRDRSEYLGERDIGIRVGNILAQVDQNEADAAYMRNAASFALTSGEIGAGATLLRGIGQTSFGTFGFGSTSAAPSLSFYAPADI